MRRMLAIVATAALGLGAAGSADGAVIYSQTYAGPGNPLHGQAPTVDNTGGGATWVTRADADTGEGVIFLDNGVIDSTDIGNGSATLAFTPQEGWIYTLDASFGSVAASGNNWVGLGFTEGQSTESGNGGRFLSSPTTGYAWTYIRSPNTSGFNYINLGPGATNEAAWLEQVVPAMGDPVDVRIVLNTGEPAWSVQWYAKNPTDVAYTLVGEGVYVTNPTIGGVGYVSGHSSVVSSISAFELSGVVIPEPATALLLGGAVLGLGIRRW